MTPWLQTPTSDNDVAVLATHCRIRAESFSLSGKNEPPREEGSAYIWI